MKILFCIAHIGNTGGQATQSARIMKELAKTNDVLLITLKTDNPRVKAPCKVEYAGKFSFPMGIFRLAKRIGRHKDDYDVVQCFDGYYSYPAALISQKKPYFLRMGMDPQSFLREKGVLFADLIAKLQMLPVKHGNCARFIVNSASLRELCKEFDPALIHNGFDLDELKVKESKAGLRKRLRLPQNETLLLYHGKVLRRKNLAPVLEAIDKVDAKFVVVGEIVDREYFSELERRYRHVMHKVIIKPEINLESVKYYLKACDIFVFPSLKEGSPNSLLEAMAAGMPAICSDTTSHKELIADRKNGFVFHDAQELKKIISLLAKDKALRKRVGKNALEYIKQKHDIRNSAKKYLKLYAEHLK
jgi:glycosyltransferase involved in cell wall biosynthesis